MIARCFVAGCAVALGAASLCSASPPGDRFAPGVLVRVYELGGAVASLPELAPDQLPNVARVSAALRLKPGDFCDYQDNFCTEITGELLIESAGTYGFRLISDDGARLWLGASLLIDHDGLHGPEPKDGEIELAAGAVPLRIWHFEAGGGEHVELQWRPPGKADFSAIPAGALQHAAAAPQKTAPGIKRVIPALRRGRPGDGSPLTDVHPRYTGGSLKSTASALVDRIVSVGVAPGAPLPPEPIWVPASRGDVPACDIQDGHLTLAQADGQIWSVAAWPRPQVHSATVLRLGAGSLQSLGAADADVFEITGVTPLPNGLNVCFSRPLDPRVGWEPDAYLIEQWPFDAARNQPPRRDGVAYAAKSATVSQDRRCVFIETEPLKTAHVAYLRLLPPLLAEDGATPLRSTEVWLTLNHPPTAPPGRVGQRPPQPTQNALTAAEQAEGWQLLFDGRSTDQWRNWKKPAGPLAGWSVVDGCLVRTGPGGDIVTTRQFTNFELKLEWRVSSGGNSGIFFHVGDEQRLHSVWQTGPEMQVLDNIEHRDGGNPKTSAGANYALHAPLRDVTRPVGLFNEVRLVVRDGSVEHWLNGERVVAYQLGSPEWAGLVAASKFSAMPDYGRTGKGHIALQDHGDRVWYRNIRIRPLP